jgi:hypothetical protein
MIEGKKALQNAPFAPHNPLYQGCPVLVLPFLGLSFGYPKRVKTYMTVKCQTLTLLRLVYCQAKKPA